MSFRTRDRSTTRYYGNHDPYITPTPRARQWRAVGALLLGPVLLGGTGLLVGNLVFNEEARSAIREFEFPALEPAGSGNDAVTVEYVPRPPIDAGVLAVGDSFDVPCDDGTGACMTITLGQVDQEFRCNAGTEKVVALTFRATMLDGAPRDFQNPFQSPNWTAVTHGQAAANSRPLKVCAGGVADHLDLEFISPETTASGSYWLPVPEETAGIHLASLGQTLLSIPLTAP